MSSAHVSLHHSTVRYVHTHVIRYAHIMLQPSQACTRSRPHNCTLALHTHSSPPSGAGPTRQQGRY